MKIKWFFGLGICLMLQMVATTGFSVKNVVVAPDGNDAGDGSLKHPFLTLGKARDFIREKRLEGAEDLFVIQLRGGDYSFSASVEFDNQDQNLKIMPYKQEKVRFFGGSVIDPANARPVVGTANAALFGAESQSRIRMIDLKKLGITDYGELFQVGFGHPLKPSWMELFVNGKPYHLSRWPNDSTVRMSEVIDKGSIAAEGDSILRGGKFRYTGHRPSRWKKADDIWLCGYFRYGWADDAVKLAGIDTVAGTFTTALAHRFGFFSKEKWNRWYAYNIPEEIDEAGEYYIDRIAGILYFYAPDEDIKNLEVSVFEKPFVVLKESSEISIENVAFECSRGMAVEIESAENCLLKNCTFTNLGLFAVRIDDLKDGAIGKHNGLSGCTISETGDGGVQLFGGNRLSLDSAANFVENCRICDYNRITKTYCAGVKISGVGNRISHCEIYRAPHNAILLSGNDHLIEYNDIHDVCQSTEDAGALYYGRNPSERGHTVRFNYFHEIGSDLPHVSAVYHDDGACGMTVFGNIFYKAGNWASQIGGGSDNPYINNIFIDCPIAIAVDDRLSNWAKQWLVPGDLFEKDLKEIHYDQVPYRIRYPELTGYWNENPAFPKRNVVDRNVFIRVPKIVRGDKVWLEFSDRNLITDTDPGFVNEKEQIFQLKNDSEVFSKIPGFQKIPFWEIGPEKSK